MLTDFIALIAFGTDTKHAAHSSLRGFICSPVPRFSHLGLNIFLSKFFPQHLKSTIFFFVSCRVLSKFPTIQKERWSYNCFVQYFPNIFRIWSDFDRASSLICGNKMQTRCNRWFLLQILLLAQHVLGTTMPIIRSSRVLYKWLLPVVFGALVFKLSEWCGQLVNQSTKYHRQ
jgi:hypothetical protein